MIFNYPRSNSLLQVASSIIPTDKDNNQQKSQLQAKRILYVKSLVRLLRLCGSKYQQLLATPDGIKSFQCAVINLLTLIDNVVTKGNLVLAGQMKWNYAHFSSLN